MSPRFGVWNVTSLTRRPRASSGGADDTMYNINPSLYLHAALFAGQGGRYDPLAFASPAAARFAQALHISRLEELDCMPTDMDEPFIGNCNDELGGAGLGGGGDGDGDGSLNSMQSAATSMAQIFTGQMDAYYDTAAQLVDHKSLALYMSSAVGHSQGTAAAIAVASAGHLPATLEAYARCALTCFVTPLRPPRLIVRSARDSTLTKSMSWLGLRSAESASPLHFTRASYSKEPFNTWPGAAPAACYGTLDDYDDLDEAPWALRFGVDPNVPPEPAAPRCAHF